MKNTFIGIDPGSTTGVAIWIKNSKTLSVFQFKGHCLAMDYVRVYLGFFGKDDVKIRIEDARLMPGNAYWAKVNGGKKDQGVGGVKALSKDWEIFCQEYKVDYELLAPNKELTKKTPEYFEQLTGIKTKKTHDHMRDAGMLVFGA